MLRQLNSPGLFSFSRNFVPQKSQQSIYADFVNAIENKNIIKVKQYLRPFGYLLFQKDTFGVLPLHIAIKNGSLDIVEFFLKDLTSLELKNMLQATNSNKWTALHFAAVCGKPDIVSLIINKLGAQAHSAAEKIDSNGKVPLNLCNQDKTPDAKKVRKLLKAITLENPSEDMTSPILLENVIKEFPYICENKTLLKNISAACIAASHVRSFIDASTTHPTANRLSKKDFLNLYVISNASRKEYDDLNSTINEPDENKNLMQKLKNMEQVIKRVRKARCGEYGELVLYTLVKMGIRSPAERYTIKHGDHVFVVFDKNKSSSESDFTQWGNNAVVIDAWAGKVYPAREIPNKLRNFIDYRNPNNKFTACITVPFDPDYYKLKSHSFFSNNFLQQRRKRDYSDFSREEMNEVEKNQKFIRKI